MNSFILQQKTYKFAGVYITPGKFGQSVYTPNNGLDNDKMITLGTHENSCLGKIPFCPEGVTVSVWFKAEELHTPWQNVITTTSLMVLLGNNNGQVQTVTR